MKNRFSTTLGEQLDGRRAEEETAAIAVTLETEHNVSEHTDRSEPKKKNTKEPASQNAAANQETEPSVSTKKTSKSGRPSKGPVFRISLNIDKDLEDGIKAASLQYRGNVTEYISQLIRQDQLENEKKYKEFAKLLK